MHVLVPTLCKVEHAKVVKEVSHSNPTLLIFFYLPKRISLMSVKGQFWALKISSSQFTVINLTTSAMLEDRHGAVCKNSFTVSHSVSPFKAS